MTLRYQIETAIGKVSCAVFLTIAVVAVVAPSLPMRQEVLVSGTFLRNNSHEAGKFFRAVRDNNGVLILGTSETVHSFGGYSYWEILNRDAEVGPQFSVLYGAGRSAYVLMPMLLANQEAFRGMNVLMFLNPTYWRPGLNSFEYRYFDRYNTEEVVSGLLPEFEAHGLNEFVTPYFEAKRALGEEKVAVLDRISAKLSFANERFQSKFTFDLAQFVRSFRANPKKTERFDKLSPKVIRRLQAGVDPDYNTSARFLGKGIRSISEVVDKPFQTRAFRSFLRLSKELGINLTVVVGPYNGLLAKRTKPRLLKDYAKLILTIKSALIEAKVPFIDASDLSFERATFLDVQHHSAWGGYLIERKIAAYYRQPTPAH